MWLTYPFDSLSLFYSPLQTCKRFREKIVRQCHSIRQFDWQSLPLRCAWKIVQFSVFLVRRFALEKNVVNCFWMLFPCANALGTNIGDCYLMSRYTQTIQNSIVLILCVDPTNANRDSSRQVVGSFLLSDCAWVALIFAMVTECRAKRRQFSTFSGFVWCNKCQSRSLSRQFVVPVSLPECGRKAQTSAIITERRTICTPFRL